MAALERQRYRPWLGAALLAGVVASASLVFFLDDILAAMTGRARLVAVLVQARNLRAGAPVWIAGKRVGDVVSVEFLPSGVDTVARLALTLEVAERHLDQVTAGSTVRITSDRFIGEPVVDIVPGPPGPSVRAGDTLYARRVADRAQLIAKARALRAAVEALNVEARQVAGPGRGRALEMVRLESSLRGVQREFDELGRTLETAPGLAFAEEAGIAASLERLNATAREIGAALDQARVRHGDGARAVASALDQLARRSNALASDAAALAALIDDAGTLRRLQADSALLKGIHAVRAQLDSLIMEARRNPLRFVF
jgi:ABC-type transporter Mla subunit MlaD